MILVKTTVRPSNIDGAGLGLFAEEFIKKGTLVWEFTVGFDFFLTDQQVACLPAAGQEFVPHYAYRHKPTNLWVMCADNGRFMNHADQPNVIEIPSDRLQGLCVAADDIEPGTELTCNYDDFDDNADGKLSR